MNERRLNFIIDNATKVIEKDSHDPDKTLGDIMATPKQNQDQFDFSAVLNQMEELKKQVTAHAKDRIPVLVAELRTLSEYSNKSVMQVLTEGEVELVSDDELIAELKKRATKEDGINIAAAFGLDTKPETRKKNSTQSTAAAKSEPNPDYDWFKETYKGHYYKNANTGAYYAVDSIPGRAVETVKAEAAKIRENPALYDILTKEEFEETPQGKAYFEKKAKK